MVSESHARQLVAHRQGRDLDTCHAEGMDKTPSFNPKLFVETNVPGSGYGYGCACLIVETNAKAQRITKVSSGKILPLAKCRNDKALPNPEG